jgi:hypothetical protein
MTYINIKDKEKMKNKWFRTKDLLYFKDTGQSWDILHWTDEEYQDFISKEYSDQKGQLERLNQVGTR